MMDKLPNDLIARIGGCMDNKLDVTRFRSVCQQMRSSIPPYEIKVPIQVCIQGQDSGYTLVKSIVYHLGQPAAEASSSSVMEWVVKVREVEPENRCLLLHPLSTSLPLEPNSESFPDELNVLDFHVLELARCYSLRNLNSNEADREYKVVISSDPHWHALMVMTRTKLQYCKLSASVETEECTVVQTVPFGDLTYCQDVIFYKSKFYVVEINGRTVSIDSSLMVKHVAAFPTSCLCRVKLVESLGDLLLVETSIRHGCNSCKVYKLHELAKQWAEFESLKNDRSLFVDDCTSFSASTQNIPGCLGNHIFSSSDPYMEVHQNLIKVNVRLLMDSEVAVVELRVHSYNRVDTLREHLDVVADFPLPLHYIFMHQMSVMFEKRSFDFHKVRHGHTIDVVPIPQALQEQEQDVKVLMKCRGSKNCYQSNFGLDYQIHKFYLHSPKFSDIWGVHEVYHELMTSRGPTLTRLDKYRSGHTYTNVRNGDTLQIVRFKALKIELLKVNVIVDHKGTMVDMNVFENVKELRKELEKMKLQVPRQYYFNLLVQNDEYLMDEEVLFYNYLIYHEDAKYDEDGTMIIGNSSIVNIKVCPYMIINKNNRRRLHYNQ